MTCDVCGREMWPRPVKEPVEAWQLPVRERWFCGWCYAWTELGHDPGEAWRPQYAPVDERWERAESPRLPEGVAHAYDTAYAYTGSGATLCGIRHEGLSVSPYPWMPGWDSACGACKEAAAVIDRRWPPHLRDGQRENPTPPPGSAWPPF
ncbi:hypothetical protein ABZ766_23320 [Streptomyces sp. NPDC006670]|uniref:hypothetical protein n=1 Tax=Streptomyces sp. NPDC006670 TaxID=3154476 RepID=UPI0033FE5F6B